MSILIFTLIGIAGLFAHWLKKWTQDQTTATLWQWWAIQNSKASVRTALTFATALFGFLSQDPPLTWATAYGVFLTGYALDSALNKGE